MGIVNKSIPRIYRDNLGNIKVEHSPTPEEVSIDDAFDPLFNAKAREYLTNKYGNAFVGTLGGYAEMWDNALAPKDSKWGKLGPAMGILGTFGRTLDKAEDFILGGVTEGVNALNYVNPLGTRAVKPSNPIENIFIKDEDYSGQRLFAAMANSISKLAGGTTLNEEDFKGTWAIPSIGAELMTDPGILGGAIAKVYNPTARTMSSGEILKRLNNSPAIDGTTLGDVAQLLSNYDDLLAKGAWDVTLPGFRPLVKNAFSKILKILGASDKGEYVNTLIKQYDNPDISLPPNGRISSPPTSPNLMDTNVPGIKDINTFNYTQTVKDYLRNNNLDINNMDDTSIRKIFDDILEAYPSLEADPEFIDTINQIKAVLEARDMLVNPPDFNKLKNIAKEYENAKLDFDNLESNTVEKLQKRLDDLNAQYSIKYKEGEDYTKFRKNKQNISSQIRTIKDTIKEIKNQDMIVLDDFGYSAKKQKLDELRQQLVSEGRKIYFDNDIFDTNNYMFKENTNLFKNKVTETVAERNDKYSNQFNKLVDEFTKDMPKYPTKANANISDILEENPDILKDFESKYFNESTGQTEDTASILKYDFEDANEQIEVFFEDSKDHIKNLKPFLSKEDYDDLLTVLKNGNSSLEDLYDNEFLSIPKVEAEYLYDRTVSHFFENVSRRHQEDFIYKTLNGRIGPYPENIVHKKNLQEYLFKKLEDTSSSPVYFSISTLKSSNPIINSTLAYSKARVLQAIYESPSLWQFNNADDIINVLRQNPNINKALEGLQFVGKDGKEYDTLKKFRDSLDAILSEQYLKKGSTEFKNMTRPDILAEKYQYFSDTILRLVKYNEKTLSFKGTALEPLIGAATDIKNALNDLTVKYDASGTLLGMNYTLNSFVKNNPYFFINETNKAIDLDKISKYTALAPDIEVNLNKNLVFKHGLTYKGEYISPENLKYLDSHNFVWMPILSSKNPDLILPYLPKRNGSAKKLYNLFIESKLPDESNIDALMRIGYPLNTLRNPTSILDPFLRNIRYNSKEYIIPKLSRITTIKETFDKVRKNSIKDLTDSLKENIDIAISKTLPEDIFKETYKPISEVNSDTYDLLDRQILTMYAKNPEMLDNDTIEEILKRTKNGEIPISYLKNSDVLTPEGIYLYDELEKHKAIRTRNLEGDYASLREQRVVNLIDSAKEYSKGKSKEFLEDYFTLKDYKTDDIITKDKILEEVALSKGFTICRVSKEDLVDLNNLRKSLEHNIKETTIKLPNGKELPMFNLIDFEDDDSYILGLALNLNPDVMKHLNEFKLNNLQDIVFHKGISNDAVNSEFAKYAELEQMFKDSETITKNMMDSLGFKNYTHEDYIKHALIIGEGNPERVEWLDNLYTRLGLDTTRLEDMSARLTKRLNLNGVFNTYPMTRSLRGNITAWNINAPVFSTDPAFVLKQTFSSGIYANQDVQTYIDLFVNDNFKLSTYKLDEKRLKDILYLKDSKGRLGNLNNLELVSPIYDKNTGRLIRFKRYDATTELGIQQALKDSNTILVPTWSIAPLDKILRKDAKMSNKVYAFFNKYFNLPFKFGTLINPGFLVGNFNDALMKQTTTMATKYGTSFADELVNTMVSVKQVIGINNEFTDRIWSRYLQDSAKDIEKYPYLKVLEGLSQSSASFKHFKEWIKNNTSVLTTDDKNLIRLWWFINSTQSTAAFRDLDVMKDLKKVSEFDVAKNPIETLLDKVTLDNKIADFAFNTSESMENVMRSANVLNDLTHKYSIDEIERIINPTNRFIHDANGHRVVANGTYKTSKEFRDLQVNVQNAINAMNNANFDYNNMPDLLDFMSTLIPFPTFYLKNMGYWLDIAVNNPEVIDTAITIQDNAWKDRQKEIKSDRFAAEAKGRGAVPIDSVTSIGRISSKIPNPLSSVTPQLKGIFKPTPLNSMFSAFNTINNPVKDLGQRVHPMAAPLTHHLLDSEDVKYRPYSSNPYEKNIKKGDPNFSMLHYTFHRLNPYERALNVALRTPNKLTEGTAQLYDFAPSVFQPDFSKKSGKK